MADPRLLQPHQRQHSWISRDIGVEKSIPMFILELIKVMGIIELVNAVFIVIINYTLQSIWFFS